MTTQAQARAESAEWIASAPGIAMDPDNSYGLQCKDVADQYGIDLFQVGLFVALKGGDAMTVLEGANPRYYDVIRNDPNKPDLIPQPGDVIVWGGSASNPYGHVAVVKDADRDGVTVVQQDGFKAPLKAFYFNDGTVRYYSQHPTHVERLGYWNPGTGMVSGWLRPKPGVVVYSGADKRGYGPKPAPPQSTGNYRLEVRETFPAHTDASLVRAVFGVARPAVPISDVIHWWDDPSRNPGFDSVCRHFETQGPAGVSAHYVLEAGRVRRGVAEADASHANGHAAANAQTVTWECNPRCSVADRETLAQALADAWIARGMTRPGVVEMHKDYHPTACPGAYEKYLPEIRARAAQHFHAKRSGSVATQSTTPAGSDPIEELFGVKRGTKEYNDVIDDIAKAVWSYKNPKDPDKTDAFGRLTRTYKGLESVARAVSAKRIALAVWGYTNEKVNGTLDAYGLLTTVNRNTVKELQK